MRKCLRWTIAGLVVVSLGFYPLLAPPPHRIDEQHLALIQNGMTLAEVGDILGQPAGDYDWALAVGMNVVFWDIKAPATSVSKFQSSTVVIDAASNDAIWADLAAITLPNAAKTRFVTTVFLGPHISGNVKTWTSRHGSCTIWFDEQARVSSKSDWGSSRIEPPWQRWWKSWTGK